MGQECLHRNRVYMWCSEANCRIMRVKFYLPQHPMHPILSQGIDWQEENNWNMSNNSLTNIADTRLSSLEKICRNNRTSFFVFNFHWNYFSPDWCSKATECSHFDKCSLAYDYRITTDLLKLNKMNNVRWISKRIVWIKCLKMDCSLLIQITRRLESTIRSLIWEQLMTLKQSIDPVMTRTWEIFLLIRMLFDSVTIRIVVIIGSRMKYDQMCYKF